MKLGRNIVELYRYDFEVSKSGLVGIFVSARCRAKGQDDLDDDEDLRVKINGLSYRENFPEKNIQQFNIPPAFNGSKLKGLKKQVVFLTVLKKGKNTIDLIPQKSAFVEDIGILGTLYNIEDVNNPKKPHTDPKANEFGKGVNKNYKKVKGLLGL